MARLLSLCRAWLLVSQPVLDGVDDRELIRRWWFEVTLMRLRWLMVPLLLLLIPLFPTISWPLLAFLALGFGFGNAGLYWFFQRHPCPKRLPAAPRFAIGLDWTGGLGGIALFSEEPTTGASTILLLLLVRTAVGFRLRGLFIALISAFLALGALVIVQVHQVLELRAAHMTLLTRVLLLSSAALILAGWIQTDRGWRKWEGIQRNSARAAELAQLESYRRERYGLSKREWELLPLLAREDYTYEEIGAHFSISPYTVKTHAQRIGQKLGVSGRWAIVSAARERGLLPVIGTVDTFEPPVEPSGTEIHPYK